MPRMRSDAVQHTSIDRFLERLSPQLARSFAPDQLSAIELHFGMRYRAQHLIDWRTRFWFPFIKIYVVLLAGREQR